MSDNTSRAIQDLKKLLNEMPSPAIHAVISKWSERIDSIEHLFRCGIYSELLFQERKILRKCLEEIQAAYYTDNGNP